MKIIDLQKNFYLSEVYCRRAFLLMNKTFIFYQNISLNFASALPLNIKENKFETYFSLEVKPFILDPNICQVLEEKKDEFLALKYDLKAFINSHEDNFDFLSQLSQVIEEVSRHVQHHIEFYKYQSSATSQKRLLEFIVNIDQIGLAWELFIEKYTASLKILQKLDEQNSKPGYREISIFYCPVMTKKIPFEMVSKFVELLQLTYHFIEKTKENTSADTSLEVMRVEIGAQIDCLLLIPESNVSLYRDFFQQLPKRPTKIKAFVELATELVKDEINQKKKTKNLEVILPSHLTTEKAIDEDQGKGKGKGKKGVKTDAEKSLERLIKGFEAFYSDGYMTISEISNLNALQKLTLPQNFLPRPFLSEQSNTVATSNSSATKREKNNNAPQPPESPSTTKSGEERGSHIRFLTEPS